MNIDKIKIAHQELAQKVIDEAKKQGATAVDVYLQSGENLTLKLRQGRLNQLQQAQPSGLGVRVYVDDQSAFFHMSGQNPPELKKMLQKAVNNTKYKTSDHNNRLPETPAEFVPPDVSAYSDENINTPLEKKIDRLKETESAALNYHKDIFTTEVCAYHESSVCSTLANSRGFCHSYPFSLCYLVLASVAKRNGSMQRGRFVQVKRNLSQLQKPDRFGTLAASDAVLKLGAQKIASIKCPVLFDQNTARSFLGHLSSALNGDNAYKASTFLGGKIGQQVASELVTVVDDGLMEGGLMTVPFDDEGFPLQRKVLIDKGVLTGFMYDWTTGNKADAKTTGNGFRQSYSSLPSISHTNFYLEKGGDKQEDLLRKLDKGFLVGDFMGFGVNVTSGQFSLGASGFWVENGKIAHPVHEVTLVSNMKDILMNIVAIENQLNFDEPLGAPWFLVSEMTVAGK